MADKHKGEGRGGSGGGGARAGHVVPADPALAEWLERLWTRGNAPDRIELWHVLGPNKDIRRAMVFYENFSQNPDRAFDIEQTARLVGEMLKVAQDFTDAKQRVCSFELAVIDYHQKVAPLVKPIGPLIPERSYAGVSPTGEGRGDDDEDGGGSLEIKPLTHRYLSKMVRSMHRTMEQVHVMMGDFMQLQQGGLLSAHSHNERLQNANMALHLHLQDAADRSKEREVYVEKERMKIKAIGSSLKVGENLIYGWFGMSPEAPAATGAAGEAGGETQKRHPPSAEQRLASSFLEECKDEKLSVTFFGDWQDPDKLGLADVLSGVGLNAPGIFNAQQFGTLVGVSAGLLPPAALDALLPDSGKPAAITLEQLGKAAPHITQGMRVALDQIRELRMAARERAQAAAQPAPAAQLEDDV